MVEYLQTLFGCSDNRALVQKVNEFFTHVKHINGFAQQSRQLLCLDDGLSVEQVLARVTSQLI
jgi:hypothetical protein